MCTGVVYYQVMPPFRARLFFRAGLRSPADILSAGRGAVAALLAAALPFDSLAPVTAGAGAGAGAGAAIEPATSTTTTTAATAATATRAGGGDRVALCGRLAGRILDSAQASVAASAAAAAGGHAHTHMR
jgi:hypothetical protein